MNWLIDGFLHSNILPALQGGYKTSPFDPTEIVCSSLSITFSVSGLSHMAERVFMLPHCVLSLHASPPSPSFILLAQKCHSCKWMEHYHLRCHGPGVWDEEWMHGGGDAKYRVKYTKVCEVYLLISLCIFGDTQNIPQKTFHTNSNAVSKLQPTKCLFS